MMSSGTRTRWAPTIFTLPSSPSTTGSSSADMPPKRILSLQVSQPLYVANKGLHHIAHSKERCWMLLQEYPEVDLPQAMNGQETSQKWFISSSFLCHVCCCCWGWVQCQQAQECQSHCQAQGQPHNCWNGSNWQQPLLLHHPPPPILLPLSSIQCQRSQCILGVVGQ